MDQFRAECKSKGFVPSSEAIKVNESDFEIVSSKFKRSLSSTRLIRSNMLRNYNESSIYSTQPQEFNGDSSFAEEESEFDGVFHSPSDVANYNIEALCGNLSGQ